MRQDIYACTCQEFRLISENDIFCFQFQRNTSSLIYQCFITIGIGIGIGRPANPYGFAVLFYGETDNLRIYGQVKIITVKPDLPSMVFSLLCLTKLSSSVTIIWAVVGLPVGDIYICACICSCFPLRKCSKTKKRRTREIAYKCF